MSDVKQLHPVVALENRLKAIMEGRSVPNVITKAPSKGKLGRLWNPYVQDSNLARKGITGAEVAQILCEAGYVKIWFQGAEIKAGTSIADMPSFEVLRASESSLYEAVKPMPSRHEFFKLIPGATERNAQMVANG